MRKTKTPVHARFAGPATALVAVLALALPSGPAVGQTTDDAAVQDAASANADHAKIDGIYVHAGLATSSLSLVGYDAGYGLTVALGDHSVFDLFRGEVELSLASLSLGDASCPGRRGHCVQQSSRALSATANAYYDYHNRTAWTPFVGVGVGLKSEAFSGSGGHGWHSPAHQQFDVAFQASLGVAYAATDDLAVQLALRPLGMPGPGGGSWFQLGARLNR